MIENNLVPKHELLNADEDDAVLKKYKVTRLELPKIKLKDSAILHLKANIGDIIKITRTSPVTGRSFYYRVVIDG